MHSSCIGQNIIYYYYYYHHRHHHHHHEHITSIIKVYSLLLKKRPLRILANDKSFIHSTLCTYYHQTNKCLILNQL
jgi:hypothetical protein